MPPSLDTPGHAPGGIHSILAHAILASRYLLLVFFFGLMAGLALFALRFLGKLWSLATRLTGTSEEDFLIDLLHLVDGALVASLVVMVALSSYDSLVGRLQGEADEREMRWVGRTDHSNLKIKVATRNIPLYRDPAVLLIDHLKHIHIEGELDVLDTTIWYAKLARKDFHVGMNVGGSALDDPDVMFYENYACGSERNYTSYCNKDMQARFDRQSSELDPAKRKALVNAIDHDLQIEGVRPAIYHVRMNVCRHPYVKGITFAQSSQYNHWRLEDAWLDK